jgi:hypothetical protein
MDWIDTYRTGPTRLIFPDYRLRIFRTEELPQNHRFREEGYEGWTLGFGTQVHQKDTLLVHGGNNGEFQAGMTLSVNYQSGFVTLCLLFLLCN